MTSGVALDGPTVRQKNQENGPIDQQNYCSSEDRGDRDACGLQPVECSKKWSPKGGNKRQMPAPSASVSRVKKMRTAVQPSHSSIKIHPALSQPAWLNRVQKVTPTVSGIEEVANHLMTTKSRSTSEGGSHSILALPTECTYEACTLLSWGKDETIATDDNATREEQLDRLKIVSSTPSVHVYLQHHNIKQIDQLLDFPKKAYATKQNPKVCSAFNEARLVFQKLADQFWPGPVHLYLPPQSFAPDGLIQTKFHKFKFLCFRCPSHPLAVKVLKQVHQEAHEQAVLVGSPITLQGTKLLRAKDVASKFIQSPELHSDCRVEILHGEERREIFAVPTCQFRDEWLECWIVPEKRTIVLRGKSNRDVTPQLKEVLRSTTGKNRIICSVLQHWKVADHREK